MLSWFYTKIGEGDNANGQEFSIRQFLDIPDDCQGKNRAAIYGCQWHEYI